MKMTFGRQFLEASYTKFFQTAPPSGPVDKFWERDIFEEEEKIVANDHFESTRCSFLEYDHGSILPQDLFAKPQSEGATFSRSMCGGFKMAQTVFATKKLNGRNEKGNTKNVTVSLGDAGVVDGMVDGKGNQMRLLFHTCGKGHVLEPRTSSGSDQCDGCGLQISKDAAMWRCSNAGCSVSRCAGCRVTYICVRTSGRHVANTKPRVDMGSCKTGDACWCLLRNDGDVAYGEQGEVVGPGSYEHPVKAKFAKGTWTFKANTLSLAPLHVARTNQHATCVFDVEKHEKDFLVGQVADVLSVEKNESIKIKMHETGLVWTLPKRTWTTSFRLSGKIEGRYCLGEAVDVNWKGKGKYYPATITKVRPGATPTYDVKYKDGHKDHKINPSVVRRR